MPKTTGTKRLNKTQRLPWPEVARQPYGEIVRLHKVLTADITISIERGTRKRNKFVIAEFVGYIEESAKGICACCQEICSLLPEQRGRGRFPRWYTSTEEVQGVALELLSLAERMRPAIEQNKLISLKGYCEALQEEALKIATILKNNPYRSEINPWIEVVNFVEKAFEEDR